MADENNSKMPVYTAFTQQDLFACRPLLTPKCAIAIFCLIGIVFIPIGMECLQASGSVVEYSARYDSLCVPQGDSNAAKEEYMMEQDGAGTSCAVTIDIDKKMDGPVYIYYELTEFYQNHRRYVKSRSDAQLRGDVDPDIDLLEDCKPQLYTDDDQLINPCGLVAWSYFNDTYGVQIDGVEQIVNETGIAWDSDVDYKFAKFTTENFNDDPDTRGGGEIVGKVKKDEHFIVWMRTATLPKFRKLWGKLDFDIEEGTSLTVDISNRYNTYRFGGQKSIVLTTTSFLGGKNNFIGAAYLAVGVICLVTGLSAFAWHFKNPRPFGPAAINMLSWNK